VILNNSNNNINNDNNSNSYNGNETLTITKIATTAKKMKARQQGRYTLDIFARDIAIKRYCDKKIILSHRFLKDQGKLLTKIRSRYLTFFSELTLVGIETCDS